MSKVLTVEDPASSVKMFFNPGLGSVHQISGDENVFLLKQNYKFLLDSELNFAHMVEEMMATVNGTEQVKI